ncbi:MAG: glycosyltransferase, partial [Candidatus Woesearchaeota archaeon]
MRVAFYAVNGAGVGHITRTVVIAKEIRKLEPKAEILFITNSEFASYIEENGFAYTKLPLQDYDPSLKKKSKEAAVNYETNSRLVASALESFEPNIVVYDCYPPYYAVQKAKAMAVMNVLLWRKDTNKVMEEWLENTTKNMDLAMLVHPKEEFEAFVPKQLMQKFELAKLKFMGYVVKEITEAPEYDYGKFNILVSQGGGGWPASKFMAECIKACEQFVAKHAARCFVVAGPLFKGELKTDSPDIKIVKYEPKLTGLMKGCDVVVCQAGYNISNELVLCQTPAIMVPAERDIESQDERASWLESKGFVIKAEASNILEKLEQFYMDKKLQKAMKEKLHNANWPVGNEAIAKEIGKEWNKFRKEKKQWIAESAKAREHMRGLEHNFSETSYELKKNQEELGEVEYAMEKLEAEYKVVSDNYANVKAKLEQTQELLGHQRVETVKAQASKEKLEQEATELKSRANEYEQKLGSLSGELEITKNAYTELSQTDSNMRAELAQVKTELEAVKQNNVKLNNDFGGLFEREQKQVVQLNEKGAELARLNAEFDALQLNFGRLQDSYQEL